MQSQPHYESSLTLLQGTPVTDGTGQLLGKVADVAVATGAEAGRVAGLVLKTQQGPRLLAMEQVRTTPAGLLKALPNADLRALSEDESLLLLGQDIVDRQIIDVHGRKVVRVNDVDLAWRQNGEGSRLVVAQVEVGLRGAVRRLLKGTLPPARIESLALRFGPRVIPWEFVDVIEVDPARRVRLKIEYARLAQMHPSDIADILEELAPAEREAVFTTLKEEVAADALEEVEPRLQQSLIASLDSERVADIVEEMDPGAAADLLAELPEARSEAILHEMQPEERQEVEELLEFREDTAAGRMTTDYIAVPADASVAAAVDALRAFEGDRETLTEVYLLDSHGALLGTVPLARLLLVSPETELASLSGPQVISCRVDAGESEVAELFDKYNLRALPVVDRGGRLVGMVEADHVIAFLRRRH
jgi:magnesium transporter